MLDYDPSKWVILLLYQLGLVRNLRQARPEDIKEAQWHMHVKANVLGADAEFTETPKLRVPEITIPEVRAYIEEDDSRVLLLLDEYVVNATDYIVEHVCFAS